jgi:hypothetical protein
VGDIASHPGTKGDDTELNWLQMLARFRSHRYGVARAFVVDSQGHQSQRIDLVIRDRHFPPLLFETGYACYIPAESVYAAFEIKQSSTRRTWSAPPTGNRPGGRIGQGSDQRLRRACNSMVARWS